VRPAGTLAAVYRVFETLDALVTVVEEARGLPMTSNCVVPRGDVLDLLDELREALPGELDDAQDVLDHRDELMSTAERRADEVTEQADQDADKLLGDSTAEAQRLVAQAQAEAEELVARARHEAERTVADAQAQHQDLVQRAHAEAERMTEAGRASYEHAVAEGRAEQARLVAQTEVVQAAHIESGRIIDAGEREADRLRTECDQYIESSLTGFEDTLTRTLQTVQRGRLHRGARRPGEPAGPRDRIGTDLLD
jgi:cell division septum initiation protein DivIVA